MTNARVPTMTNARVPTMTNAYLIAAWGRTIVLD